MADTKNPIAFARHPLWGHVEQHLVDTGHGDTELVGYALVVQHRDPQSVVSTSLINGEVDNTEAAALLERGLRIIGDTAVPAHE